MSVKLTSDWFEHLYQDLYPRLYRYALRFVEPAKASEVTQECFEKLLKMGDKVDANFHVSPWLFNTCRNHCIDEIRRRKNMKSTQDLEVESIADASDQLDERIYQHQVEERLKSALLCLNFKEREVIRLKFQEGFSYQQISEITGHSLSYVGVLIHECIQKIKKEMSALNDKGVQNGKK